MGVSDAALVLCCDNTKAANMNDGSLMLWLTMHANKAVASFPPTRTREGMMGAELESIEGSGKRVC